MRSKVRDLAARPDRISSTVIIIGHRGASGYRPEHTLAAYQLAIDQGADFIEPDLVATADGVLVCRHENEISATTDVAGHPEFAARRTTKTIDGTPVTGWFTEDFTLAELKTLRAKERIPGVRPQNTAYDGRFEIPTFAEVLALVAAAARPVGVYPETKHPSYFRALGLPLEEPLLAALQGFDGPVFIQSFEIGNLRDLHERTDVPLIQLVNDTGRPQDFIESCDHRTYADLVTPAGLDFVATYAAGIGPAKHIVIPTDAAGHLTEPTRVIADAHARGLAVHAWTFRREPEFLPAGGDFPAELRAFAAAGLDAVFTDNPDVCREVVEEA